MYKVGLYGAMAQGVLQTLMVSQLIKNALPFMESEFLLSCLQERVIELYPDKKIKLSV
jgi:hypothetical protein